MIRLSATELIRRIAAQAIPLHEQRVARPIRHQLRLLADRAFDAEGRLTGKVKGRDAKALITADSAHLRRLIWLDRLFLRRLALDGPQGATFCPHSMYLYDIKTPITDDVGRLSLRYMQLYSRFVAGPAIGHIAEVEEKLVSALAEGRGRPPLSTTSRAREFSAINRSRRFFLRRREPQVPIETFFFDI